MKTFNDTYMFYSNMDTVIRMPELLAPGGVAVLYTMEYKLLKSCLSRARGLTLREQKRTEAGGLLPWIFVVDRDDVRC